MKAMAGFKALAIVAGMAFAVTGCDNGDDGATGPAGPEGPAGQDGQDGAGGASAVSVAADRITTMANDLRGLTYATVAPNAGKIYASGFVGMDEASRLGVVARFNANGSPDTSFGDDGFVELDVSAAQNEQSLGVAELQSGDVVVTVQAADDGGGQSVYLFRIAPDGTPAAGWGDADGKVEVAFGWANADNGDFPGAPAAFPSDTAWDVQTDKSVSGDRVVVFGLGSAGPNDASRTDNDRFVTRLDITATGAVPDATFNGGEPHTFHSTGTLGDNARRGLVEADGKIMSAGYTNLGEGLGNHVILIRLTNTGELDTTFGGFSSEPDLVAAAPGIVAFNPYKDDGGFAECYAALPQSSGSFVTTGYGAATSTGSVTGSSLGYETTLAPDIVAFRVLAGTATDVDTSWGNTGQLAVQSEGKGFPTSEDRGRHLVVLPDDRSIHVGRFGGVPAAVVMTADGQPDTSVFGDGIVELTSDTVDSQFFGAALSADGKRVALSTNSNANGARLVVLKVAAD
ncbi:hypothetical protein [Panacagrimonas sp.]|uniref:hypothetical protein n=1 Tax=Panacagrimonas sp. TaxID=2480088 RepID=UPI003B51A6B5